MRHSPFEVSFNDAFCGPITYEATFKGEVVDSKTLLPVAYDSSINTFTIYSEDFALIGTHTITVSAKLTNYPVIVTFEPLSTQIQIIDPCPTVNLGLQPSPFIDATYMLA